MTAAANHPTCIYCPSTGPFTKEHIFPAGLGGDDAFQLVDLVCGHCNKNVFSPLDQALMRKSPTAVGRIFRMTEGRRDGGPPQLASDVVEMAGANTQLVQEMELLAGGKCGVRPQILFNGIECPTLAADHADMQTFIATLLATITSDVKLIVKEKADHGTFFHVTSFQWDGSHYHERDTTTEKRPPALGIWREALTASNPNEPDWIYVPRLFLRREGQLVLRVLPDSDVSVILRNARIVVTQLQQQPNFTSVPTEKPNVRVSMTMAMNPVHRAMAKTGVNHVCHEYGDTTARLPAFDLVKQAIRTGTPQLDVHHMDDPTLETTFNRDAREVHLAMLWPFAREDGTFNVLFGLRLFGTPFQGIMLAEGVALDSDAAPVIYTVHYQERRTVRQSLPEYLLAAVVPGMVEEGHARADHP
jgi:hypothetical protein